MADRRDKPVLVTAPARDRASSSGDVSAKSDHTSSSHSSPHPPPSSDVSSPSHSLTNQSASTSSQKTNNSTSPQSPAKKRSVPPVETLDATGKDSDEQDHRSPIYTSLGLKSVSDGGSKKQTISSLTKNVLQKLSRSSENFLAKFRQKNAELHKIFKDLPQREKLIDDYACALQREILAQGRMYITQSYLCFYANIFTWETLLIIPLSGVQSITKERTALVFPNAIQITSSADKYGFSSFIQRDVVYNIIFRIWQNCLLNQPMGPADLYRIARKAWGDPPDFSSEEDLWGDPTVVSAKKKALSGAGSQSNQTLNITNASMSSDFVILAEDGELLENCSKSHKKKVAKGTAPQENKEKEAGGESSTSTQELPTLFEDAIDYDMGTGLLATGGASANSQAREDPNPPFPPGDSDSLVKNAPVLIIRDGIDRHSIAESLISSEYETLSISESGEVLCGCDDHDGCTMINDTYDGDIETIFQLLFTDSVFMKDFLRSRKTTNVEFGEWYSQGDGSRIRDMKYTLALNYSFGPKYSPSTERQIYSKLGQLGMRHIVDVEVVNGNIPYSDNFYVRVRFCLTRVTHNKSRMRVVTNIAFRKNCWGIVKNLIERNAGDGLRSYYSNLDSALKEYLASVPNSWRVSTQKTRKSRSKHRKALSQAGSRSESPQLPQSKGHSRNPSQVSGSTAGNIGELANFDEVSKRSSQDQLSLVSTAAVGTKGNTISLLATNRISVWMLFFVSCLVICNMILYYWLMAYQAVQPIHSYNSAFTPKVPQWPTVQEDWLKLMKELQQKESLNLQSRTMLCKDFINLLLEMEGKMAILRKKIANFLESEDSHFSGDTVLSSKNSEDTNEESVKTEL